MHKRKAKRRNGRDTRIRAGAWIRISVIGKGITGAKEEALKRARTLPDPDGICKERKGTTHTCSLRPFVAFMLIARWLCFVSEVAQHAFV